MTLKERVIRSLEHKAPDVCPWNISFTIPAAAKLRVHYGGDFGARLGNHLATIGPVRRCSWTEVKPGYWRDHFGVVWNRTIDKDIGNPDFYLLADGDLSKFRPPDPDDDELYRDFPEFCRLHADEFIMGTVGFSLFERAWTLRGMENLLIDMVTNPAFVEDLFARITEWNLAVIDRMCRHPLDAIHLGDDWGQQRGLIMGPDLWRKFIRPCLKRMYGHVKSKGKYVSIHSCGDIEEVLGDLIDLGLDMFNPFQPEVMDVEAVKREFGRHLTFHGGISTQKTLPYGTPADVRAEVKRRIETIGADGGYVCAPAHDIPGDVPLENLLALIEAVNNQ